MKYFYKLILLFCFAPFLAACSDDDYIDIESLNANGDEFYCNQKVKVWMCVHSSDLWHTDYQWSCDGGSFTQPQGLNEMTWKAPAVPGTYTISCTATVGGKSQTRQHKMYVSSYYFDKFEGTSHSMSLNNQTSSLKKESNGNQYLQTKLNSSTEPTRRLQRSFGDNTLQTPFYTRVKMGFESNIPTTRQIKVGTKTSNSVLEFRWNLRQDATNTGTWINQIRLLWFPTVPTDGYPDVPANAGGVTPEGTTDYNVQLTVQYTDAVGKKTSLNEYRKLNAFNTFKEKEYKTVSMGVDENYNLEAYVAGQLALQSDIVAKAYTQGNCIGGIFINNWETYILNGDGAKNLPVYYFDDAYASFEKLM